MPGQIHRSLKLFMAGMAFSAAAAMTARHAIAQPAAAPAAAPATALAENGAALEVIVLEVKGTVQVSVDDGKTWTPAKAGMHLSQGASFRTGFHSSVTCGIPPDQGFTLESLGTVRVEEAVKKGKKFKTDLVMKYGATNYSIETGGAEHESTIRTPGSTLSVRGTEVRVTDRPGFAPGAESFTGRGVYTTAKGTTTVGSKGGKYARVSSDQGDSSQTALNQAVVDPTNALARTTTDAQLIAQQTSLGAVVSFDKQANITVVQNSAPLSDAALIKSLPGTLDFVLRWTGNADLNLEIYQSQINAQDVALGQMDASHLKPAPTQPLSRSDLGEIGEIFNPIGQLPVAPGFQGSELLYPGYGFNVTKTGGVIPYDNRGGPKGGMEIAYWPATAPEGIYGISALHVSGAAATYQINAYLNGKPLNNFYANGTDAQGLPIPVKSVNQTGTLTTQNNQSIGQVYYPANSYFDSNPNITLVNAPSLFADTSTTPAVKVASTHKPAVANNAARSSQPPAPRLASPAIPATPVSRAR